MLHISLCQELLNRLAFAPYCSHSCCLLKWLQVLVGRWVLCFTVSCLRSNLKSWELCGLCLGSYGFFYFCISTNAGVSIWVEKPHCQAEREVCVLCTASPCTAVIGQTFYLGQQLSWWVCHARSAISDALSPTTSQRIPLVQPYLVAVRWHQFAFCVFKGAI